jgi:prepilin-type N-terminal cleavage/methylation domain-containing protein
MTVSCFIKPSALRSHRSGFTLLEVVISMGIMALLAASVYAIVGSAIGASRTAMEEQLAMRRLDSFLRVTRQAFLNLPAEGTVSLEVARTRGGEPEPQLFLGNAQGLFGLPSLGGGTVVLAARPRSDGTRTLTLLRIPAKASPREREEALAAPGIPLLPKVRKPRWSFYENGGWKEELPAGSPRPSLVQLQMDIDGLPRLMEVIFYVPPLVPPPAAPAESPAPEADASPSPSPNPSPDQ